jgi:hypothetical protein
MQYPYPVYPFIGHQTKIVQEPIAFTPQTLWSRAKVDTFLLRNHDPYV